MLAVIDTFNVKNNIVSSFAFLSKVIFNLNILNPSNRKNI